MVAGLNVGGGMGVRLGAGAKPSRSNSLQLALLKVTINAVLERTG